MNRRSFFKCVTAAAGTAVWSSALAGETAPAPHAAPAKPTPPGNPFQAEGNWYKAALHVHTTTSDGDVDVPTRLKQYRDLGYHVVAVTDHWKTNDLSGFSDGAFLAINGMEAHPRTGTGAPAHHFVCLDLPHPFELDRAQKAQDLVDKVREAGGKVIYAHPYWTAHTLDEMRDIVGFIGIEVYNAVCDLEWRKGYGHVHADQAFTKLGLFTLTAVDDVHRSAQINRGWTMVRARELTKNAVMAAIAAGHVYASTGPAITDFRIDQGAALVACSPAAEIRFFFNGAAGGRFLAAKPDQPLTAGRWTIAKGIKWVRAEVVDAEGKSAWTNPIAVD